MDKQAVTKEDVLAVKPDCLSAGALELKAEAVGVAKAANSAARVFVLALMAGMQIGTGALFMLFVKSDATLSFAAAQVLGGLCFSLGLICVIVAGSELFTGNNLMVIAALQGRISWGAVLKNWVIVWAGNFLGSLLLVGIVAMCAAAGFNGGAVGDTMVATAYAKINLPWVTIFFRGIMCNFLVCLAVWMGFAGRTVIDKIFTSILPVMAFVALGFEHCVANMFFLPMGVAQLATAGYGGALDAAAVASTVTWSGVFFNISAATLGNIVGGAILVGCAYWLSYHAKRA